MILFFDTETTGLPNWHMPSDDPTQPHIVQLAAMLTDDEGVKCGSMDFLIQPAGWTLTGTEAAEMNGLTDEICEQSGVPVETALDAFFALLERADLSVAFNRNFDARMIRIALKKRDQEDPRLDQMKAHPGGDPIYKATQFVKAAPTEKMIAAGRTHFKTCKLTEAYEHFFGETLEGAHDALVDVRACARVYFHLRDLEKTE